jgi:hypothetical protein
MGNTLHLNKIIYILLLSSISIFGQIKLSELTLVNTLKQTDRFLVTQYLDSLDILTGDSVFQSRVVTWAWFQQYIADSVNFRVADTLDGNLTAGGWAFGEDVFSDWDGIYNNSANYWITDVSDGDTRLKIGGTNGIVHTSLTGDVSLGGTDGILYDASASGVIIGSDVTLTGNLSGLSADLGTITAGSINIGTGAFTVSPIGALVATSATITGAITGSTISTSTITGGTVQTAVTGQRVVLNGASNRIDFYTSTTNVGYLDAFANIIRASNNFFANGALGAVSDVYSTTGNIYTSVGYIDAVGGFKDNGTAGIDGTYTDGSSGSFTISGGIITGKTDPTQTHTTSVNNPTSTVAPGSTHWNVSTGEGWIYFPTNGWTMVY